MRDSLFCMRLNTAGVVIGWVGAAASLITIIMLALGLSNVDAVAKNLTEEMNDPSLTQDGVRRGLIALFTVYLAINLINLIASSLLVLGTIKERHLMLVPWLLNAGISLLFSLISFVYFTVMLVTSTNTFGNKAISLLFAFVSVAFQYIIWDTIYSLYKKLQAARERQKLLTPTTVQYPVYNKA